MFDAPRDTALANPAHPAFERTATLFTQQWVGIRQACGALPGTKIAIDGDHVWNSSEVQDIAAELDTRGIRRVVSHGMAPGTRSLLAGLKAANPEIELFGVWHGTMAAWAYEPELRLFNDFAALSDSGIYKRVGFLRSGMPLLLDRASRFLIINVPPATKVDGSKNLIA